MLQCLSKGLYIHKKKILTIEYKIIWIIASVNDIVEKKKKETTTNRIVNFISNINISMGQLFKGE